MQHFLIIIVMKRKVFVFLIFLNIFTKSVFSQDVNSNFVLFGTLGYGKGTTQLHIGFPCLVYISFANGFHSPFKGIQEKYYIENNRMNVIEDSAMWQYKNEKSFYNTSFMLGLTYARNINSDFDLGGYLGFGANQYLYTYMYETGKKETEEICDRDLSYKGAGIEIGLTTRISKQAIFKKGSNFRFFLRAGISGMLNDASYGKGFCFFKKPIFSIGGIVLLYTQSPNLKNWNTIFNSK